jgi:DNA-binding protein Fis
MSGCGCKNKGNQSQQPTVQQAQTQQTQTNESVKSSIKKTIEKYYNVNKTSI